MAVIDDILRKLFTNKTVLKKLPGGRLKTIDLDKLQSFSDMMGDSSSMGIYSKSNSYYNLFGFNNSNQNGYLRNTLYADYELMDSDALISAALDAYSDESTSTNERGEIISIITDDDKIKKILYNLYHDILNIDFNLWYWVRSLVKYGDFFLYLNNKPGIGVTEAIPIHASMINRIENFEGTNEAIFELISSHISNTYQFPKSKFFYHEIAHFRILSDTNFLPYGRSLLEGGRKDFKKLCLLEDAVLIHRIMRAPDRRLFKIDVGNIPPESVDAYMEKITNRMQKIPYIDPQTGDYNLHYNLQPVAYYTQIPLLDGRNITIKELSEEIKAGKENWVYSIDRENNNAIVPGKVTWCDLTKENSEIVRIILDDDSYIDFEPSHPVMLRDGNYVMAKDVLEGDSLMPLYTKLSDKKGLIGYELVYNPATETYEYTHRIVSKTLNIDDYNNTKNVVHHINFDKLNNDPNNLDCSMEYWQHIKYHRDNASDIWKNKTQKERDEINKKRSASHKKNVENGSHKIWNKGQIKETNDIILNISNALKKENNPERGKKISKAKTGKKRPDHSRWMKENYVPYERTDEHLRRLSELKSGENNHNYGKTWEELYGIERAMEMKEYFRILGKENAKYLTELWNDDEYRIAHGKRMSEENKRRWADPNYNKRVSDAMKDKFDDYLFNNMVNIIINNPKITCHDLIDQMNTTPGLYSYYLNLNKGRKKPNEFKLKTIQRSYMNRGFDSYKQFRSEIIDNINVYKNHKAKSITYIKEREDVYCMSVEKYHNFAIDSHDGTSRNGIFVKNSSLEDYYIPVRGGDSGTSIESLSGLSSDNAMQDLEYVKNKLLSYLRIPKAYLGNDEGTGSKSVLAAEDIKFARFIERIQKLVVAELEKIGYIHLFLQGFSEQSLLNFKLELASPSIIYERQKIDLLNEKINMVNNIIDKNLFSKKYIYENIFGLTESEWQNEQDLILEDVARSYREEQIKNEGNDPVITGKSFGTAHDLALLYMKKKEDNSLIDDSAEGDLKDLTAVDKRENNPGRPEKEGSFERQKDPTYGVDPTGRKDLSSPLNAGHDKKLSFLFNNKVTTLNENENKIDELLDKLEYNSEEE